MNDVVLGQGYANGESPAIGRIAALDAGLGTGVPGLQVDRAQGGQGAAEAAHRGPDGFTDHDVVHGDHARRSRPYEEVSISA